MRNGWAMAVATWATGCAEPVECLPTPGPGGDYPELDAWLEETREAEALVGLAAAISGPDGLVWSGGAGWEDIERTAPVEPDATMFRWASLSKGVAGVVASSLADEGVVDLHADLATVYPDYAVPTTWLDGCAEPACEATIPEEDRHVTLHRLLTHTAGTMHYDNGQGSGEPPFFLADTPLVNTGMEWALGWWVKKPLVAVPGTAHVYSSFGYNLAGVALEHASGRDLWSLVRERVVAPAGACTLQPDYPWVDIPRRAVGYGRFEDVVVEDLDVPYQEVDTDVTWKLAAGGFVSTVEDLARWCDALVHERVLPRDVLDATAWAPQVAVDGGFYGYGFWRNERHGELHLAHSGGTPGAVTFLSVFPESQVCFAVVSNSRWAPIGDVARALEDAWWALDADAPEAE